MNIPFYIIALVITIILCRFVFSIDTIVINLKAQTKLLVKIAEKHNVPADELLTIVGKSNKSMLTSAPQSIEQKRTSIE